MSSVILIKMRNSVFKKPALKKKKKKKPGFHASKYTYCSCQEAFGKSHGLFQKEKKCTCKAELHPFFFFNCNVILELYCPFFLPTPSLNSCFRHLPSLCGTVFRELSASKESKRKIFLQSVWH